MKKIIGGILGIFLVIGIVAGTGYALFSSQVSMNGMVLGTATPNLQIKAANFDWSTTLPFNNVHIFAPLLPGEMDWGEFYLRNLSNGTTDKLDFNLAARITAAAGDWNVLKDVIKMRVCIYNDVNGYHCDEGKATDWMTLAQWNASPRALPGNPLLQGAQETHYTMVFFIDSSYANTVAGKTITDAVFEITGTQVL